ncbi:hypothetical protein HK405_004744 [Cladochytrium tenue]|nr:hypothetical protein HK405_004744 [Cladochytrium tenue]
MQATHPAAGLFDEGVRLVFERWTALQLAIANDMGGRSTLEKASQLHTNTVDFFLEHGASIDPTELADNLHAYFEDCFDAALEDGSPEQVARTIVALFAELAASTSGPSGAAASAVPPLLARLRATARPGLSSATRSMRQATGDEDEDGDDGDEQEDGARASDVSGSDPSAMAVDDHPNATAASGRRPGPVVDEDGFELVQKGGRRRR